MPTKPLLVALCLTSAVLPGVAGAQGVVAYPARGQGEATQERDHYACHEWAIGQSGVDPAHTVAPAPRRGGAVKGALGGGAIGAIGGAIGGDAGEGAAIGAATGAIFGGVRQANRNAAANTRQQDAMNAYDRALAACLKGRGYTVD